MPTLIIPDKICKKCKGNIWDNKISNGKNLYSCSSCRRNYLKKWREKNKDKAIDHSKRYNAANPDKIRAIKQRWVSTNKEKIKIINNECNHEASINLSDEYVKVLICQDIRRKNKQDEIKVKVLSSDISSEQVSLYKEGLQFIRNSKNNKINMNNYEKLVKLKELHTLTTSPENSKYKTANSRNNQRSVLRRELGVKQVTDINKAITSVKKEILNELQPKNSIKEYDEIAVIGVQSPKESKLSLKKDIQYHLSILTNIIEKDVSVKQDVKYHIDILNTIIKYF